MVAQLGSERWQQAPGVGLTGTASAQRWPALGFHLNNQLTQALTSRYRDSRLRVDFERFVSCAAQLTCIFRECCPRMGGVGSPMGHRGRSTGPLCTGHCSQHLDGGEGVICLTRRQVSQAGDWGHAGGQAGAVGDLYLRPTVFSPAVDGGGHLLLGSPRGAPVAGGGRAARSPAFSPLPAWTGVYSTGRGPEQNRPLCLSAWHVGLML